MLLLLFDRSRFRQRIFFLRFLYGPNFDSWFLNHFFGLCPQRYLYPAQVPEFPQQLQACVVLPLLCAV